MSISKQLVVSGTLLIVIAIAVCDVQADQLAKYGEFSYDKDGFVRLCLTLSMVIHESNRYARETVAGEFNRDKRDFYSRIGDFNRAGFDRCKFECATNLVPTVYEAPEFGGSKYVDALCAMKAKFGRLEALFDDYESEDEQVVAIKKWVREMRDKLHKRSKNFWAGCEDSKIYSTFDETDEYFAKLVKSSESQFEEEKLAINDKLTNLHKERQEHDERIREQALAEVREDVSKFLPAYSQCWLEKEHEKTLKPDAKQRKGFFSKIGRCFSPKCDQ